MSPTSFSSRGVSFDPRAHHHHESPSLFHLPNGCSGNGEKQIPFQTSSIQLAPDILQPVFWASILGQEEWRASRGIAIFLRRHFPKHVHANAFPFMEKEKGENKKEGKKSSPLCQKIFTPADACPACVIKAVWKLPAVRFMSDGHSTHPHRQSFLHLPLSVF